LPRSYLVAIPDLTTQGAHKSWLSAIGSGGHDRGTRHQRIRATLLPAISVRRLSPGHGWPGTGGWRSGRGAWSGERRIP